MIARKLSRVVCLQLCRNGPSIIVSRHRRGSKQPNSSACCLLTIVGPVSFWVVLVRALSDRPATRGHVELCASSFGRLCVEGPGPEGLPYSHEEGYPGPAPEGIVWPPVPLFANTSFIEQPFNSSDLTKRYTEKAISFIQPTEGGDEQPFFLHIAYEAVRPCLFPNFKHEVNILTLLILMCNT